MPIEICMSDGYCYPEKKFKTAKEFLENVILHQWEWYTIIDDDKDSLERDVTIQISQITRIFELE